MPNNKKSEHPCPQLINYLTTHDQHEAFRGSQHATSSNRGQAMAQHLHAWDADWARMSTQNKQDIQGMKHAQVGEDKAARQGEQEGK